MLDITDTQKVMIAFSVYKSSKYLFDCVADKGAREPQSQPYPTVDEDALTALRIDTVDVVKRMDYAEVDKLVACCQQHPPQTTVVPATHGDEAPFQEFTKYLKARKRAGVVMLPDGRLLVLAPLENSNLRIRCVVVKARTTAESSSTMPPRGTTIRVDAAVLDDHSAAGTEASRSALPPLDVEQPGNKQRRVRFCSRKRNRTQHEQTAATVNEESTSEPTQKKQVLVVASAPGTEPNEKMVMLHSLPRIERATCIAQLQQDYEAFNKLHYDTLREWSKSDPDN